jgi:RNA polymerase sigma factor (sigma-70 family)
VQEAFVRAVRLRRSYTRRGSLDAWLWRIVVNTARDMLPPALERIDKRAETTALTDAGGDDRRSLVQAAVQQLPERQRLVLFLRHYADLDYGSIAVALAISDGTVAATLHAAHSRLRQLLSEVRR